MYFTPKFSRNIHKLIGNLEKDIKQTKKIDLPITENLEDEFRLGTCTFFRCFGNGSDDSLSLVKLGVNNDTIVHYKITCDEFITRSEKKLESFYIQRRNSARVLENLPIVIYHNVNVDCMNNILLHIIGITSTYLEKCEVKNISLMFDYPVYHYNIYDCGDCIIFVAGNQEYLVSEILILKIQFHDGRNCEVAEIFRKDLSQFIDSYYWDVHVNEIIEKRVFLQYKIKDEYKGYGCILDLRSGEILNLPPDFMESESMLHVVKHGNCDLLITVLPNEVKVLRYLGHGKFKSKQMDFDLEPYAFCTFQFISNRNSQALMVLSKISSREIHVFDLFDLNNKALLFCGSEDEDLHICFNDSGEEIYVFHQNTLSVYFYRSPIKSLLSLAADVVRIIYTETELKQMNLPRDLYKNL